MSAAVRDVTGGTSRRRSVVGRVAFIVLCLAAGALFFLSLPRLWPLARTDLVVDGGEIRRRARAALEARGLDLAGYLAASRITVDASALDYVESAFGRDRAQSWIEEGLPLVRYRVYFKRRGETTWYIASLHPGRGLLGFETRLDEDRAGARIVPERARELALHALRDLLGADADAYEQRSSSTIDRDARRDHAFRFERSLSASPELTERVDVTVTGEQVASVVRRIHVPDEARRTARAAEAPERVLETLGIVLATVSIVAAFFVFLGGLRDRTLRLGRALVWPGAVLLCLMLTYALERATLFLAWEPLWPGWVSDFQYLSYRGLEGLMLALLLLVLVGAGDCLDSGRAGRGASLWLLARGRVADRAVARSSATGFLVGLLCGGVLATTVELLRLGAGASTSIQPRGFFFYTLNSASPAASSLLFFLGVALAEELGYRFFGGTWLERLTGRRWLAIALPALIYGLTHTRLDFLPPADPWWGRALTLTLVGAVWGWAFFRFDALTVVLSHFTADLFIFSWPRLASGQPAPVVESVLLICVPLLPAVVYGIRRAARGRRPVAHG